MNCSLKSDRHFLYPYGSVHTEVLHLIRRAETTSCLTIEKIFPRAARNFLIFEDGVAKLCHCLRFLSFLKRRVSSYLLNLQDNSGVPGLLLSRRVSLYLHPELHDCVLSRQVSLYLTNLFDNML